MIKQSSGEDWISTNVSLSTATPSKGGNPPTLDANNLRVRRSYGSHGSTRKSKMVTIPTIGFSEEYLENVCFDNLLGMNMQKVEEQHVTLHSTRFIQRFDTTRPATVPSDGTEHKVIKYDIQLKH